MTVTIAAVKYACDGEAVKEPHKVYNLQPSHNIFQRGELSELSALIGMPLVLEQLRPSLVQTFHSVRGSVLPGDSKKKKKKKKSEHEPPVEGERPMASYFMYGSKDGANYFPNDTAARLMVVCSNSGSTPLFLPPSKWINKVGSVLIARQDMVPLHPMHIEILKSFITAVHENLVEQSQGKGLTAKAITDTVTPQMWQAYWQMATDHMLKTGQGAQLEGVRAPFGDLDPVETRAEGGDDGHVQLSDDSDMMDYTDVGFTQ